MVRAAIGYLPMGIFRMVKRQPKPEPSIHRTQPYDFLFFSFGLTERFRTRKDRLGQREKRHASGFPRLITAGSIMSSATAPVKTPGRVTFSCLTPNNIGVVRKLNSVLFPVRYAEKYYKDILALEVEEFCQLGERAPLIALWGQVLRQLRVDLTRKEPSVFQRYSRRKLHLSIGVRTKRADLPLPDDNGHLGGAFMRLPPPCVERMQVG